MGLRFRRTDCPDGIYRLRVLPAVDRLFFSVPASGKKIEKPEGLFPTESSLDVTAEDAADRTVWHPLFRFCIKVADRIHHLQSGYLHLYILIMVIALLAMLVWGFLFDGGVSK